jgi:transcription-repair coupling factor (superfamily II helicase)
MYKKLKKVDNEADIISLIDEFVDRFGDPPQSVMNLIELTRLNTLAGRLGVKKITETSAGYRVIFREDNKIEGDYIVNLLDEHPKKLRIKNAENPEIFVKEKKLNLLKKVLKFLKSQVYSIEE